MECLDDILAITKNYINDAQSIRVLGEYTYEQQRAVLVNIKAKQGAYTGVLFVGGDFASPLSYDDVIMELANGANCIGWFKVGGGIDTSLSPQTIYRDSDGAIYCIACISRNIIADKSAIVVG